MFDRFIRLAKVKKALQDGRLEQVLALADDPLVRSDRRADDARREALERLWRRAKQKAEQGDAGAARADLDAVLAAGDHAEARTLRDRLRTEGDAERERAHAGQKAIEEGRRAAEQGRLAAAEAALASAAGARALAAARASLEQFVAERRQRAAGCFAAAAQRLAVGDADGALAELRAGEALDRDRAAAWEQRPALAAAAGELLAAAVHERLDAGDPEGALAAWRLRATALPEAALGKPAARAGKALARALRERLAATAVPAPDAAATLARAVTALAPELPDEGGALRTGAEALLRAADARAKGLLRELATDLAAAAGALDGEPLRAESRRLERLAGACDERIAAARAAAAAGDWNAARAELVAVLAEWPMHGAGRRELDLLDQGAQEQQARLCAARTAAREGRLRNALAQALGMAGDGASGAEAQLLCTELRARMDLVRTGLDQVRAAVHGCSAATAEGVRHCLLRVEELAKVWTDGDEIPAMRESLQAELDGLRDCEAIAADLDRRAPAEAADAFGRVLAVRPRLLSPERLDARLLALSDRAARTAEDALAAGRLEELAAWLLALDAAGTLSPDLGARALRLRAEATDRRAKAEELVAAARAKLGARDLEEADRLVERSRQLQVDGGSARKLEEEIESLRRQEAAVARVESLAAERDFAAAHRGLHELPPTPALLRTRIYDMKQNLARAQGLDGSFLLRVDEGGEFLVLRGESITIGNVRESRTDLPILANIAGRHARIARSMSFHGGMQDTIHAEEGELRVGGQLVTSHRLRAGDKAQLGPSLQLRYEVPSTRSLSASLALLGGFQVAGTDRVFLLKDRGRDGRLLLGQAQDAHVRVANARGEVEVFAHKTGQIRVRCDGPGTIDGKPFTGEHPVEAGVPIVAAGIGLVLLPWR